MVLFFAKSHLIALGIGCLSDPRLKFLNFPKVRNKALLKLSDYILSGVSLEEASCDGAAAFKMTMPSEASQDPKTEQLTDRDFMAWLPIDFHNGTIDVEVFSELAVDAPSYARGFIGLSFRIDPIGRFESIYLRPTNSASDDQVRRNHSVQYVAYPDYRFYQLREESPEKYESYAELDLGRWIHMKIVVSKQRAVLFLDNSSRPSLIVNDLKLGPSQRGGVGVWIEAGTMAHFKGLTISKND
jgi:hypothetical protein